MDRRNFLRTLVGGVAVTAAARTWPFRVYSFPTDIVKPLPDKIFKPTPLAGGILNQQHLEATYQKIVLGYDEPDLIWIANVASYARLRGT